ncbi:MAG: hypothetical protein D6748_05000 [Calditrichaeota bacterium]|nr:MAG: hypothetical protein D6748_05000 [Calditrichota bacterium]
MHRKNKKKFLTVQLLPDNVSPPRSFQFRYTWIYAAGITAGIVFLLLVAGLITYSQVLQAALQKGALEKENIQLREQLQKIGELQAELELLRSYNERVRNSLQGYVTFSEAAGDESAASDVIFTSQQKYSLFTSVPQITPMSGFISQEFKWPDHPGIDIVAPEGTPIKAAADGIVAFSGWTYEDGYFIILYHPRGYSTLYKHNSRNLVSTNQIVHQGEVIAFSGNSGGTSSGPHLHLEIWKDGFPINPRQLLVDLTAGE